MKVHSLHTNIFVVVVVVLYCPMRAQFQLGSNVTSRHASRYSDVVGPIGLPRCINSSDVCIFSVKITIDSSQFTKSSGQKLKKKLLDLSILSCADLVAKWIK